ncbi:CARDB domain-containing protein [Rhodopirellula sp. MGV]|uniref:CARDB domain-containing protein n=1 Tax=Rhodopirellula sp. MGV TaxID=2023130 RepID=UPI001E45C072|nr:CARDB domain-containing protein [Rhodopirellula sp. MGV]
MTSITSSANRADELHIQALNGGTVEIGTDVSETVMPYGAVQFVADGGADALASLIDLPNLTSFTGYMDISTAGFFPKNGGSVLLGNNVDKTVIRTGIVEMSSNANLHSNQLVISNGSTLRGSGTITGSVLNEFAITPSPSANMIAVTGSYQQSSTGQFVVEIGGLTAGTHHDQIAVGGEAIINGKLQIVPLNGYLPSLGQEFLVLSSSGVAGAFSNIVGAAIGNNIKLQPDIRADGVYLVAVEDVGPKVIGNLPSSDVRHSLSSIDVAFDEPLRSSSISIDDFMLTGPSGLISIDSVSLPTPSSVRIHFAVQTEPGDYTLKVGPDIDDSAGNPMDQDGNGTGGEATDIFETTIELIVPEEPVVFSQVPSGRVTTAITNLQIGFSVPLEVTSARNSQNYTLTHLGADQRIGGGDDQDFSLTPIYSEAALDLSLTADSFPAGLPDGYYQLRIFSGENGIQNVVGGQLDGNDDGTPGDDYVGFFQVNTSTASVVFALAAVSDTGVSAADRFTNDATPTFDVSINQIGQIGFDFDRNGVPEQSFFATQPGTYSFTHSIASDGIYHPQVLFQPAYGNQLTRSLAITLDRIAPVLLEGSANEEAPTLQRQLNFSEAVTTSDGSTAPAPLSLTLSGPSGQPLVLRDVLGNASTYVVSFDPLYVPGDYEIHGTEDLFDLAGNRIDAAPVDRFKVLADVTNPLVSSFSPLGATNQNVDRFRVVFSEPMDTSTIGTGQFEVTTPNGVAAIGVDSVVAVPNNDVEFEVVLTSPISQPGDYRITISQSVADLSGNSLSGDYSASITIDRTGAAVTQASPVGMQNRLVSWLDVTFDSPIDSASFRNNDIVFTGPLGAIPTGQPSSLGGNRFRIPFSTQRANGSYQMTIGPQVLDLAGNPMDQNRDSTAGEAVADTFTHTFRIELPNLIVDESAETLDLDGNAITSTNFGTPIQVRWESSNIGLLTTSGAVAERVWLSKDAMLSSDDKLLSTISSPSTTQIQPGGKYAGSITTTIPLTASSVAGQYYLLVQTDAGNTITESDEQDNFRSIPLELVMPPLPDLVVTEIVPPASLFPGDTFLLQWKVDNRGDAIGEGPWIERVYLANTPEGNNRQLIASFERSDDLTPLDNEITRSESIDLPLYTLNGDVYIIVDIDSGQAVFESDENNRFASTTTRNIPPSLSLAIAEDTIFEGGVAARALVTRNGDVSTPLNVTLSATFRDQLSFPSSVIIPAGQYSTRFDVTAVDENDIDRDVIVGILASAVSYPAASDSLAVINNDSPTLDLSLSPSVAFEGGVVTATITRGAAANEDTIIRLTASETGQFSFASSVILPAGQTVVEVPISVIDDRFIELAATFRLTASAAGHTSTSQLLSIESSDIPTLRIQVPSVLSEGTTGPSVLGRIYRDVISEVALQIELDTSYVSEIQLPSSVIIPAGQAFGQFQFSVADDSVVSGDRNVNLIARALTTKDQLAIESSTTTSAILIIEDDGPTLNVSFDKVSVSEGRSTWMTLSRNTADNSSELTVTIENDTDGELSVPLKAVIPAGINSIQVPVSGIRDGVVDGDQVATLTASANGFRSGTGTIVVTDGTLPDLQFSSLTTSTHETTTDSSIELTWTIANSGFAPASDSWTQRVYLSDDAVIGNDLLAGQYTYTGPLGKGQSYNRTVPVKLPSRPGQYWIVVETDAYRTIAEGLETNNTLVLSRPIEVQPEYTATVSTETDVAPADTPVLITGVSVNTDQTPAAFKQVRVHLSVRGTKRVYPAITDANGNFSVTFRPLPGEGGTYTIGAAHPGETTVPVQDTFKLVGMRAEPASEAISIQEADTFTAKTIAIQNLSDTRLTGIAVEVINAKPNLEVVARIVGNGDLVEPNSSIAVEYSVRATDATLQNSEFQLRIVSSETPAIMVPVQIRVVPLVSRLVADTNQIANSMLVGGQTSIEFNVTNTGGKSTGGLEIELPSGAEWISLASSPKLNPLGPGESTPITLLLTPPEHLPLTVYNGTLIVRSDDSELIVPFRFRAVSEGTGDLRISITDEYYYFTEGKPLVKDATVRLLDPFTGKEIVSSKNAVNATSGLGASTAEGEASITIDADGRVTFLGIPEGAYTVDIRSNDHKPYQGSVYVTSGELQSEQIFVSRNLVEYTWTVEEIEIEDRTKIEIDAAFETNVPAPVVVVDGHIDLADLTVVGQTKQFDFKISNHGLIAAEDVKFEFGSHPFYEIIPLIDVIGTLPAKSEIIVPVLVRRVESGQVSNSQLEQSFGLPAFSQHDAEGTADVPCTIEARLSYTYVCGPFGIYVPVPIAIINVYGNCNVPSPAKFGDVIQASPGSTYISSPQVKTKRTASECDDCETETWTFDLDNSAGMKLLLSEAVETLDNTPWLDNLSINPSGSVSVTQCCDDGQFGGYAWGAAGTADVDFGLQIPVPYLSVSGEKQIPLFFGAEAEIDFAAGVVLTADIEAVLSGSVASDCDFDDLTGVIRGEVEKFVPAINFGVAGSIGLKKGGELFRADAQFTVTVSTEVTGFYERTFSSGDDVTKWLIQHSGLQAELIAKIEVSSDLAEFLGIPIDTLSINDLLGIEPFKITEGDCYGTECPASPIDTSARNRTFPSESLSTSKLATTATDLQFSDFADLSTFANRLGFDGQEELFDATGAPSNSLDQMTPQEWVDYFDEIDRVTAPPVYGGVCAAVAITLSQDAVLTRQGFEATLDLKNVSPNLITDLRATVRVISLDGRDVTSLFDVRLNDLVGFSSVEGGVLAPQQLGSVSWVIVAADDAAPEPTNYFVAGELSYLANGQVVTMPLAHASILVNPQAQLELDYFLQRDVFGDDPHTGEIEPSRPFTLAVQVQNKGAGAAKNLRIESAQPRIVENEKGLLVDFEITGTRVNGDDRKPSLTAAFGDVQPGQLAIAQWEMLSSLQGLFVDYNATFQHVSALGDNRFSLIKDVQIHELIHVVNAAQVDGDDGLPDFLVNDLPDPNDLPDTLYLSDGSVVEVALGSEVGVDAPPVIGDLQVSVTTNMVQGWSYLKMDDPGLGDFSLLSVIRSDGTELPLQNFWQSDRTFVGGGLRPILESKIHLLDYNSTGTYTFVFSNGDLTAPALLEFSGVVPNPTSQAINVIDATFDEPLNVSTFNGDDVTLTKNGTPIDLSSLSIVAQPNNTYRISGLAAYTTEDAVYELSIALSGLTDQVGNPGVGARSFRWVKGETAPAVLDLKGAPSGLTNAELDFVDIEFSKEIDGSSFSYRDLSLARDGVDVADDQITVSQIAAKTFRIGNLTRLTAVDGTYQLTVRASGIRDAAGRSGVGDAAASWVLDATAPILIDAIPPATNPRNIAVQQIDLQFSEPIDVDSLDLTDLTLVRTGTTANLIAGDSRVIFQDLGENRYRISGLSWVQGFVSDPQVAEFTLSVNRAGITDLAGNSASGTAVVTWMLDLDKPDLPADLRLSTTAGPVVDGRVNSRQATVSGTLFEPGLTVVITSATTGSELTRRTVEGTAFDLPIEFPSTGQHRLWLRVIDAAGNVADTSIDNLFVRESVPSIQLVSGHPDDVTNEPIAELYIDFVEPIDASSFSISALSLMRDGSAQLIDDRVTVSADAQGRSFTVAGLGALTTLEGWYEFVIDLNQIANHAGVHASGTRTLRWKTDKTAPISNVSSLSPIQGLPNFVLHISGNDPDINNHVTGSSIVSYDLYVSINGGADQLVATLPAEASSTTFNGQENTNYRFYSIARDRAGNVELPPAEPDAETNVARLGPAVENLGIQGILSSRSFVDRIEIDFSGDTNLDDLIQDSLISDAFSLTYLGVDANTETPTPYTTTTDQFRYDFNSVTGRGRLTWSLDSFAGGKESLADGIYIVELDSNWVTDVAGFPLDGDNDGTGGGIYRFEFHRLAGDADGNGYVGPSDMAIVLNSLGATPSSSRWNENVDLDRDGVITVRDRVLVARALNNQVIPSMPQLASSDPLTRFDVSIDGEITTLDALLVINRLGRLQTSAAESESLGAFEAAQQIYDVNRDGFITPVDALQIINRLARQQATARPAEAEFSESIQFSMPNSAGAHDLEPPVSSDFFSNNEDEERWDALDLIALDIAGLAKA